jgi:nucleoside-diphosphate-sugar epimerase
VKDVCRGAIQAAEKGKAGERYILAGHNLTYRDFFSQVSNLCNRPKPLAVLPRFLTLNLSAIIENASLLLNRKPMITRNDAVFSLLPHYYSSNKAERELGYVIHPLESAIKDTIDCYSNRS